MKRLLILLSCISLFGCKKNNNSENEIQAVNKNTTYSIQQNISYATPLRVSSVHPETIKVIQTNGNYYLITSFAELFGTIYDFFRSFKIDVNTGLLTENTSTLLGEYKEVGFPKSPFYYEDLNNDGIKDLFVADHGKETPYPSAFAIGAHSRQRRSRRSDQ